MIGWASNQLGGLTWVAAGDRISPRGYGDAAGWSTATGRLRESRVRWAGGRDASRRKITAGGDWDATRGNRNATGGDWDTAGWDATSGRLREPGASGNGCAADGSRRLRQIASGGLRSASGMGVMGTTGVVWRVREGRERGNWTVSWEGRERRERRFALGKWAVAWNGGIASGWDREAAGGDGNATRGDGNATRGDWYASGWNT
jgi:hypothetical protein